MDFSFADQILPALSNPESWVALLTLTLLEIVLGIDNIVFISIVAGRLPEHQQARGRTIGLMLAMATRIALLLSIVWLMRLTRPLVHLVGYSLSGKDIILLVGGLFLIFKSVHEIHNKLEGEDEHHAQTRKHATFASVIIQIMLIDIIFSLDSVITAVGMAKDLWVMIAAVVIAVGFMMAFAGWVSAFIDRHPTLKILALSFLVLIGFNLIADALGHHVPKGYTYFAMAFAVVVEAINLKIRKGRSPDPVELRRNAPAAGESQSPEI